MRVRVVCGFGETAAMCSPTSRFSSVLLPTLGLPKSSAKPALCVPSCVVGSGARVCLALRSRFTNQAFFGAAEVVPAPVGVVACADFDGADFDGADFDGADFDGADFDGADFDGAGFDRPGPPGLVNR